MNNTKHKLIRISKRLAVKCKTLAFLNRSLFKICLFSEYNYLLKETFYEIAAKRIKDQKIFGARSNGCEIEKKLFEIEKILFNTFEDKINYKKAVDPQFF